MTPATQAPSAASGVVSTSTFVTRPFAPMKTLTLTLPVAVDFLPHATTRAFTAEMPAEIDARSSVSGTAFTDGTLAAPPPRGLRNFAQHAGLLFVSTHVTSSHDPRSNGLTGGIA